MNSDNTPNIMTLGKAKLTGSFDLSTLASECTPQTSHRTSSNGTAHSTPSLNFGEIAEMTMVPPAVETFDADERATYQEAKATLKSIAKSNFVGPWDAITVGLYLSKCLIIDIPPDDSFWRFVTQFQRGLNLLFPDVSIQAMENYMKLCVFNPLVHFPQGVSEKVWVGLISDNTTLGFSCGPISLRSFGKGDVELSRLLINHSQRGKGVGTSIVELAKETARMVGCRLQLFPAPPSEESEHWDNARCVAASKKLRKWYSKLGFVNALPEMKEATRLGGDRQVLVGIGNLMSFR